jgi:beta-galactosidase
MSTRNLQAVLVVVTGLILMPLTSGNTFAQFSPDSSNRKKINLSVGWKFYLGTPSGTPTTAAYNDASWQDVSIPHTLKEVSRNLDNSNDNNSNDANTTFMRLYGYYRKHFDAPASWAGRKVFIDFMGVGQTAEVWVNDTHIGKYAVSAYDEFHFDITSALILGGANVVTVLVDHRYNADVPPDGQSSDYILWGGLYRSVYLQVTDSVHVDFPWESTTSGVTITEPTISATSATVQIRTTVKNESGSSKSITLVSTVLDAANTAVTSVTTTNTVAAGASYIFNQTTSAISNPHLWSPDSPYMYKLYSSVRNGTLPANGVDGIITKFGMRWITWSTTAGISINGNHVLLTGADRHQAWPFIGDAVPDRLHVYDAALLKSEGRNYIRLCHYPHNPVFLDALDSLGICALAEGPSWWNRGGTNWMTNYETSCRKMVRRDRNHPSIIIWNACTNHGGCDNTIKSWYNQEDPTRKTGQCDIATPMNFPGGGTPPQVPTGGGLSIEYLGGACNNNGGRAALENQIGCTYLNLGFVDLARRTPSCGGISHWTGIDYNTFMNEDGESNSNTNWEGEIDIYRIPKYPFFAYRAELTTTPFIYIANCWLSSSPTTVTVFSNCDSVELFINGTSHGTHSPIRDAARYTTGLLHPPFEFTNLTYASGELKAVGRTNGAVLATAIVNTPGAAASIKLEADASTLVDDGADMTRIVATVIDANGNIVPTATNSITFSSTSAGKIVGDNPVPAVAGQMAVLVRAGTTMGTATITATSGTLKSNSLPISIVARPPDEISLFPTNVAAGNHNAVQIMKRPASALCMVVEGRLRIPASFGELPKGFAVYDLSGHRIAKVEHQRSGSMTSLAIDKRRSFGLLLVKPE